MLRRFYLFVLTTIINKPTLEEKGPALAANATMKEKTFHGSGSQNKYNSLKRIIKYM